MSEATPASLESTDVLKLVILDQSKDAQDAARDRADERLVEELSEGGRLKRFANGIWKGNVAKEFYRQRYIQEALGTIEDSQNILTHETGLDIESRGRAINATIERFQTEYDEVIHGDAGEKREVQGEDAEITTAFKSMIRRYATGDLNDTTLREERTRFMQAYRETHGEGAFGAGLVTTDNMIEVARAVMGIAEHSGSLDHAIANMQVITGEARTGVRTEAQYNKVDKAIDRLSKSKFGSMVGPEIVVGAVTLAATAAKWGSYSVLGAALKTIAPGAGAGVWAGLRENKRMKDERSQHARERAQGKEFGEDAVRRNELEETRYESVSAQYLTDSVREFSAAEKLDAGEEALKAALDVLAQVQSRIDLSNKRSIDLISYSDAAAIGDERMALDLARAEARTAIEHRLTPEVRQALGLEPEAAVRDIVHAQSLEYIELIDDDISTKDRAFKALKAKRVAKAAAIGVAAGLVGGVIAQEFIAAADPTRAGLFEKAWGAENQISADGVQHQTLLEGFVEGQDRVLHTDASSVYEGYETAGTSGLGTLSLSNDHSMVENGDGTVNFVDPNGRAAVENLVINPDGSLPPESLDQLAAAGMAVEDSSFDKDVTTTETVQVNGDQYVQNHLDETTRVTRDFWYGNDTPGVYDQNELRVYWGGNAGIVDGGYQLSAAGMTSNGSWQGGESVDWKQASANGNLFMSISATVDTQTRTFMVPIGPDGAINISEDSPAGQFFTNENGRAKFTGAYAEVVQTAGVDEQGVVHIRPLATLVGSGGDGPITDTIVTTTTERYSEYKITTEGYDTTVQNFTEAAPVLPIESRRSLEAFRARRKGSGYGYGYGEGSLSSAEIAQLRSETSPRLLRNPDVVLNPKQELDWYARQLRKGVGDEYVEEIRNDIASSPELQAVNPGLKAIIAIPVGAVGEADNIYRTLSLYAQQDPSSIAASKILLHVNWKDSSEANPVEAAAIAKTHAEIERARADFPDLSIATIQSVWSEERYRNGEYGQGLIGHVARKLYDAAMLSVRDQMAEGTIPADRDVLLIRNDADAQGMDRHYVDHMIASAEDGSESEVFSGAVRWDTARHRDLPGFGFVSNLNEITNMAAHRKGSSEAKKTVGINMAIKMGVFAAVGGIGHGSYTGAGSDDLEVGKRVAGARQGIYGTSRSYARRRNRRKDGLASGARKVHRLVAGAGIDSKGDRMERSYLSPGGVVETWMTFDAGGARSRSEGLDELDRKEHMTTEEGAARVIQRIESNLSGVLGGWYSSQETVEMRSALAMMLPRELNGQPTYTIRKIRSPGGDTAAEFKFSSDGATWLVNHLRRDTRGRIDPLGRRVRRQLYSENTAKLRSVSAQPRFVK
jgi:hypothetical protein